MSVSRGPGGGGIAGGVGLFTVVFQAVGRGTTNVSVSSVTLTGAAGQPICNTASHAASRGQCEVTVWPTAGTSPRRQDRRRTHGQQKRIKGSSTRGMTLVELIVAFTILLILTSMAVPVARTNVRRIKERNLREALKEIHTAIDKYKDMADAVKASGDTEAGQLHGYPESLQAPCRRRQRVGAGGRYQAQISAPDPARPHDQYAGLGPPEHAGRSDEHRLGRPECFRCVHQEHG